MEKTRVPYFDFLRLLATVAVILLHISGSFYETTEHDMAFWFGVYCNAATRWAVPAFVMLSGALFLQPQRTLTLKTLYGKYILRLLIIFVTWCLLYELLFVPSLYWIKGVSPGSIRVSFVYHYPIHLWFLPMLMGVYMIFPILRVIAKDEKVTVYFLLLWFLFSLLAYFPGVVADTAAIFSVRLVMGFSGYALLGYWLSVTKLKIRKGWVLAFFFVSLALMWIISSLTSDQDHFFECLAPNVIFFSFSVFLLARLMNGNIEKSVIWSKALTFVREDLLGIYLIHIFYIDLLNRPHFVGHLSAFAAIPLLTVAVFFLSLFTIKLVRLIPIVRYIVGDKIK